MSETDSATEGGASESASDGSLSGGESNSASGTTDVDLSGGDSNSASGGSGGGSSPMTDPGTTDDSSGGQVSGGSGGTDTTGMTTEDTQNPTTGPDPVECGTIDNLQECLAEPDCSPAVAERYNLTPSKVCKLDAPQFIACVQAEDCVQPDADYYCFGNNNHPWFDFQDTCLPPNYSECQIEQQDNYPPCD